jgi:hypothetical protein
MRATFHAQDSVRESATVIFNIFNTIGLDPLNCAKLKAKGQIHLLTPHARLDQFTGNGYYFRITNICFLVRYLSSL